MAIREIVIQGVDFNRPDVKNILRQVKESGATAVQIYTFWRDFEPHAEGQFAWDYFDRQVRLIQEAGLQWVPFLLIGPKYAAPQWWLEDPRHKGLVCLEHGKENPVESIWNEALREQVRRVVKAFAEHYRPWNVIQSIQPGICGDYGESIMPVHGNWAGDYHTHLGYWCGDEDAIASFRAAMKKKYGTVQAMNAAWNAHYDHFDELSTFLPHRATSRTALFDELAWYKDSMTDFVDFWLGECRKNFPDTPIYMCVGGNEEPEHAADFAAQAKVCAKHGAGLRLTNECNRFFDNYFLTAYTHSACEFYGSYLGLEPVGGLTPEGVCARMFGSAVYGNRQMMYYYGNVFKVPETEGGSIYDDRTKRFIEYLPLLREGKTVCDTAFFWPSYVGALGSGIPDGIRPLATFLRRFTTVMPVNERMIADGALSRYKLLIMPPAPFTDAETLRHIAAYVKAGGVVFAVGPTADLELQPVAEYDVLFGILPESERGVGGTRFHVTDKRFSRFAEVESYVSGHGMFRLHPDTIEIAGCDFNPNNYSGTTTAAMANAFMREYPTADGGCGAAIMYMGPLNFVFDPQSLRQEKATFPLILQDVLEKYTDSAALNTLPGEQARGYIGDDVYVLYDNGDIQKAE